MKHPNDTKNFANTVQHENPVRADGDKRNDPPTTTGSKPGMPQRDVQGKPLEKENDNEPKEDPNPGPGITSSGHRAQPSPEGHEDERRQEIRDHQETNDSDR